MQEFEGNRETSRSSLSDLSMEDALAVRVIYDPQAVQRIAGKDPAEFSAFVSGFDQYLAGLRARAQAIANPQQLSDLSEDRVNSLKATYPAEDVEKIAQYDSAKFTGFMKDFDDYLAKIQGPTRETTSYGRLLDTAAQQLRSVGLFEVELTQADVETMMRQVVVQSREAMQKRGITAEINDLKVQIAEGKGVVVAAISAKKDLLSWPGVKIEPSADINASFGLENLPDQTGQPTGRLTTKQLEVLPEKIMGIFSPKDFLEPKIGGDKVNESFRGLLDGEMQKRGAGIIRMGLAFTPQNTLRMAAFGGKLGSSAAA